MTKWEEPRFGERCLELRVVDDEVCIYANAKGLERLAQLCEHLLKRGDGHVHLGDHEVLTERSLSGVIALFGQD
jgi:hypothetical protein